MKLPNIDNSTFFGYITGMYILRYNTGTDHKSIHLQADVGDEPAGDIYACTRPLQDSGCLCHCYMSLVKGNKLVDTRGFFNTGPAQEWNPSGGCTLVKKNATQSDWKTATEVYDSKTAQDYDNIGNNCCTAAMEASDSVPGGRVPARVYTANMGTGTAHKCIIQ